MAKKLVIVKLGPVKIIFKKWLHAGICEPSLKQYPKIPILEHFLVELNFEWVYLFSFVLPHFQNLFHIIMINPRIRKFFLSSRTQYLCLLFFIIAFQEHWNVSSLFSAQFIRRNTQISTVLFYCRCRWCFCSRGSAHISISNFFLKVLIKNKYIT